MTKRQWMQKGYFRNSVGQLKLKARKRFKNIFSRTFKDFHLRSLYLVVFAILVISIWLNFIPLFDTSFLIDRYPNVANWLPQLPFPFQQLPAMAISTAALIALIAYSRGKKQSKSEFFFKQASEGLDETYKLLRDQNNNRVIWVRAARSLRQAKKLAEEIELEEYKLAYRLYELRIRNDLYLALTIVNPETGSRNSLPPQFFFGLPDWKKDGEAKTPLDEVAKKASSPIEAYRVTIDEVPPDLPLYPLAESSVITIFDFLDYPEDFVDKLDDVEDWSPTLYAHTFNNQKGGAARYIAHRKTKYVVDGNLYERTPVDEDS